MEFRATTTGADDLDRLTSQAIKALRGGQQKLGREIRKAGRKAILDDVKGKRRGGLRFSGMNTRLGAKGEIKPGVVLTVTIKAAPPGPWSIVEHGSRPHDIEPRRKRALYFSGLWSDSAYHPGTAGHNYWASAESALDRAVAPLIADMVEDILDEVA